MGQCQPFSIAHPKPPVGFPPSPVAGLVHSSLLARRAADPLDGQSGQEEDKMGHSEFDPASRERRPWNAGKMVGAKPALKPQQGSRCALFDSKLRGCDVVKIRIGELVSGGRVRTRATVTQQKTCRPVQFELLEAARSSLQAWLEHRGGTLEDYAFPSRTDHTSHIGTRQYARLVDESCSCSWAIRKSRAPCAISEWMSKTRSPLLSTLRYEGGRPTGEGS
jgi:hypothetical protein